MAKATINKSNLESLRRSVASRLVDIENLLPKEYRLTLVARHRTNEDAHIVLSCDELNAACWAIQKLLRDTGDDVEHRIIKGDCSET